MKLYQKGCEGYGIAFGKAGQIVHLYDEQITVPIGYLAVTWCNDAGKVSSNGIAKRDLLTFRKE